MIAVATPPPFVMRSISVPNRGESLKIVWPTKEEEDDILDSGIQNNGTSKQQTGGSRVSRSSVSSEESLDNFFNISTLSEFACRSEYAKAEQYINKDVSSSVAAVLLEPMKRDTILGWKSFRSPKRHSVAGDGLQDDNKDQRRRGSRRSAVSSLLSHKSFKLKKRNSSAFEHSTAPDHRLSYTSLILPSSSSSSSCSGSTKTLGGEQKPPSARFAAFSRKWRLQLLTRVRTSKKNSSKEEIPASSSSERVFPAPEAPKAPVRAKAKRASLSFRMPRHAVTSHTQLQRRTAADDRDIPATENDDGWKTKLESLLKLGCQPSLLNVLKHRGLCSDFRIFLRKEYSEENLDFWNDIEEYRSCEKHSKLATIIYANYIQANSPREINLTFRTKSSIKSQLSNADKSTFDEAQKEIFRLMETDSYARFILAAR